ncbi:MAG: hypothetical protein IPH57_13690 [Saprospiraceae bacterium]|nr:hypothetical protein [Saprospiraceae bacterium]
MKKKFFMFGLLGLAFAFVLTFSCTKDSDIVNDNNNEVSHLKSRSENIAFYEDSIFFKIIEIKKLLFSKISISNNNSNVILDSLYLIQNKLNSGKQLTENEKYFLFSTFGFNTYQDLESKFVTLNSYWHQLNIKYSIDKLPNTELMKGAKIMNDNLGDLFNIDNDSQGIPGCKQIWKSCRETKLATAMTMAIGCGGLVHPVLVIACEVGVIYWEISELKKCNLEYDLCRGLIK